jgi:hypothetical protein
VSPSECPAHLIPTLCMFVFYLLSFLHLQSSPVRSVEQALVRKFARSQDLGIAHLGPLLQGLSQGVIQVLTKGVWSQRECDGFLVGRNCFQNWMVLVVFSSL